MFIKKKFDDIFNKIDLNIDKINLQIKQLKNIMVLDLEKLNDNILKIDVEDHFNSIFGNKIEFNEYHGTIVNDIELAKERIKSSFKYHNHPNLSDIKEYENYLYEVRTVLRPLYERIKYYKNKMKKN